MTAALAPPPAVNVTPVRSKARNVSGDGYFVQVGAFSDAGNAERTRLELEGAGPVEITAVSGLNGQLYRVRIGPLPDATRAERALEQAVNAGHSDARLVMAQGNL